MTLFFIFRSEICQRKKIILMIPYFVILGSVLAILFVPEFRGITPFGTAHGFDYPRFWSGFTLWAYQLRFDGIFLMFILPVTVGLFLLSRKGLIRADSILFLILGIIIAMPLMGGFTNWNLHPYRFIPLLVFFCNRSRNSIF